MGIYIDRQTEIRNAADDLHDTIVQRSGELADEILERPEFGSPEWFEERKQRDTPEGRARLCEWHLTKLQICRYAGISQTGSVINARQCGATWQAIADACGITRQAAYDRWAKYEDV